MSREPNLIVVGASARAAAFSTLRAGLRPYAIDLFADSDLADACPTVKVERYPQDFEAALAAAPQAPWIYTGGLENYPELITRMAALRSLYGNGADVLRKVRQPELLAACLAGSEFAVPEILRKAPGKDAGNWLRKPRCSSGGLGIRWWNENDTESEGAKFYYQRFVSGKAKSAVFLAGAMRCELLGITAQQCSVPEIPEIPFLYAGSAAAHRGMDADKQYLDALAELGQRLASEFGLFGLFNADLVEPYWLLEVNPRYSASVEVLEQARGENFLARHVVEWDKGLRGERTHRVSECPPHVAKQVVYAPSDCVVSTAMETLRKSWNCDSRFPSLADIPHSGDRIFRGQPVATVFATGGSAREMERLLEERCQQVRKALIA